MDQTFMKEKSILPLVITMAIPMSISMLVSSLYNIVDSFFVARISENAMTALSFVYPVQNLVNAVSVGFGIGINASVAYYLGAQNPDRANASAAYGILLNSLHGLVLTVVCLAVMPGFLRLFTSDGDVIGLGLQYSNITLLFTVPIMISISFEKIFQSVGRMTVSMFSMICGCVANIILDPLLIFGIGPFPAWGIKGAAIATGLGQTLSLVIYIIIFIRRPIPVKFRLHCPGSKKMLLFRLYAVGIPATLNMALPSLLVSVLNSFLAAFSQSYVLILGAYYKLQTFLYLTANGVVQGMRPLISYNYGAGEYRRVRKIFQTGLFLIAAILLFGTVLCQIIPGRLIGLFTENEVTISEGAIALRIISLGFFASSLSVAASGTLEGLGKGLPSLVISLLRYALLILPCAFFLSRILGVEGIWHAFWITEAVAAAASLALYLSAMRSTAGRPEI